MTYVVDNTIYNYSTDFMLDKELVSPIADMTFEIQKQDGTVVSTETIAFVAGQTSLVKAIPNSSNLKTAEVEYRYITISFQHANGYYNHKDLYELVDALNLPITYDGVRKVLGVEASELPDHYMDIRRAYEQVKETMTDAGADLGAIITAGGAQFKRAKQAIEIKEAINQCDKLKFLLFQTETGDNVSASRFSTALDIENLKSNLSGNYLELIAKLVNIPSVPLVGFTVSGPNTNPFTGV